MNLLNSGSGFPLTNTRTTRPLHSPVCTAIRRKTDTIPQLPSAEPTLLTTLVSFLPFILIIVAFYFFLIRPQRKQEKETQKMRNSIEIGDQITTIGGITGIVRQIKDEDTYIIETGADKNRISIKKWAIQSKDTISDS